MRKLWLAALGVVYALSGWPLYAETPPIDHIVISEVQTASTASASEEFVEIYGPLGETVDLNGWTVEYKSATGVSWTSKATLSGVIQPRGFYLVSTAGYLTDLADAVMGSGLAASGGHVRLVDSTGAVVDLVGWGTADSPETAPAAAPAAGESLKRQVSEDGELIDTDDNSTDFSVSISPEPQSTATPIEEELPPEEPDTAYLPVVISELLPDPASPLVDSHDEFIELFNPNDEPLDLFGYKIQAGSSLQYGFIIGEVVLAPGQYRAFTAAETGLTLGNSGSKAQVLDPAGLIAAELVSYDAAPSGQSWSLLDETFAWTNRVTPNTANLVSLNGTGGEGGDETDAGVTNYPKVSITELLPDPAAPQTDARDEFVELYNPNPGAVNLAGYTLKTGGSLKTVFVLPAVTIEPGTYIALFSVDANIALPNSGGDAQLLDPNGLVVATITPYDKAPEGQSWALIDGAWRWTAKPTPAARNSYEAPPAKGRKKRAASSRRKAAARTPAVLGILDDPAAAGQNAPNWRLISGVGALAAGYMVYELRYDLRNQLERVRRWFPGKAGRP